MGFDWEDTLGDTVYEDAVDMAAQALEKMQENKLALEEEAQEGEADSEDAEACEAVTQKSTLEQLTNAEQKSEKVCTKEQSSTGGGFMDGCDDEPVFD